MTSNDTPPHVSKADNAEVVLSSCSRDVADELQRVGYAPASKNNDTVVVCRTDIEKARLFEVLRGLGVAFSIGREWSPAEIFEMLRENGLISGPFTEIGWRGAGKWFTRTNG